MRKFLLPLSLLTACVCAPAAARVVIAQGNWAAIDRGATCEALVRAARVAPRGKVQAIAGFTFSADHRRWGEFHTRLRRLPRPGATVMLRVGGQPFLLTAQGNIAWSAGPRDDQAIIAALRTANSMSVEARDGAGQRFVDDYGADGAPTAIDAAAAACAGKMQPH
jgi:hypothetical protein